MALKEPALPWPDNYKIAYFLAAAIAGAIAGGLVFNFLNANDPLRT